MWDSWLIIRTILNLIYKVYSKLFWKADQSIAVRIRSKEELIECNNLLK